MGILLIIIASFIAWPAGEGVWKYIVFPLFRRWFIDVGLKGYAPLIINTASAFMWFFATVSTINIIAILNSYVDGTVELFGLSINDISGIIPMWIALMALFISFELNALAVRWSKK